MSPSPVHRWTALGVVILLLAQGVPFVPLVEYGQAAAACEHCSVVWCLITECTCPHHERNHHRHGDEAYADASEQHDAHVTPSAAQRTAVEADCPSLCGCDRTPQQSMAVSVIDKVVVHEAAMLIFDDRVQPFLSSVHQVVPQRDVDDIFHPPRAQG